MNTRKELLAEIEALKSQLKQKDEKIQSLEKLNDWYIEQLKLKLKEKFGASSEKADPNQLSLFDLFNEVETLMQPITTEPELETVIKAHTRKKSKRGSKFDNLEVKQVHYELSDEEKICDICGEVLTEMTTQTRKELVIKPAEAYILEHVTHIYSCRNCDKNGEAGNQKEYLASFMLDGRIQLSNNLAEQSVKPFVIGRKNWLFSNTINGAKASTTIYSIIQTAIANELKPEKYLEFLFTQIQNGKDVAKLVPWSDEIPEYCRLKKAQQK